MDNLFDLSGKTVLVTGANGGIGSSVASVCTRLGARIIATDRDDQAGHALREGTPPGQVTYMPCDVTRRTDVERLCAMLDRVDAAVLNAGILPSTPVESDEWESSFDQVMAVNVKGVVNFARALMPIMQSQRQGRLVLVGSVAAYTGGQLASTPPQYAMSKGAVHTFTKWLARQGGEHVQVNAVAPGVIDTPLVKHPYHAPAAQPQGRKGRPSEVAWPIAFLCSEASHFMTGSVLHVNGGAHML